jgi:thiol:disulfide interchange protein DsbD
MRALPPLLALAVTLSLPTLAHAQELAKAFRSALEGGSLGSAMLVSFLAGIGTSLTPCVYPMIAITVSVFGARKVQNRMEGALLSTSFVGGMALLFTGLGIVASLTGGVFGDELSKPYIAGPLALVFLVLAASMFGAFELALPHSWTTRLSEAGGLGHKGAFVLGMASSIIAAPCVGPVLGLLLPWIGTTGNIAFGVACMLAYSLGMGLLFWVVGTFAVSLPKSGRWMEWVKSGFGLLMVASALYFVRDWIPGYPALRSAPPPVFISLAVLVVGLALGAVHLSFSGGSLDRTRKSLGIVAVAVGALMLLGKLETRPTHEGWERDLVSAREKAKAASSPLLIDFGASWCQACGELERHTFSNPDVISESQRFVKVKVDLSPGQDVAKGKEWLSGYGARGLPLVVVHDSNGKEAVRITEFVEAPRMLELLRAVN